MRISGLSEHISDIYALVSYPSVQLSVMPDGTALAICRMSCWSCCCPFLLLCYVSSIRDIAIANFSSCCLCLVLYVLFTAAGTVFPCRCCCYCYWCALSLLLLLLFPLSCCCFPSVAAVSPQPLLCPLTSTAAAVSAVSPHFYCFCCFPSLLLLLLFPLTSTVAAVCPRQLPLLLNPLSRCCCPTPKYFFFIWDKFRYCTVNHSWAKVIFLFDKVTA